MTQNWNSNLEFNLSFSQFHQLFYIYIYIYIYIRIQNIDDMAKSDPLISNTIPKILWL